MSEPGTLVYDEDLDEHLQPIVSIAMRGQHVLSRREILKYITANPSTRAEQIQILLNVRDIERIRRGLVNVHNTLRDDAETAEATATTQENRVTATIQEDTFTEKTVLENVLRISLKNLAKQILFALFNGRSLG